MILKQKFPFDKGYGIHILIGTILGCILAFILIVLQPFGTTQFLHPYKNILLAGYGLSLCVSYIFSHFIATLIWRFHNKWNLGYELVFQLYSAFLGFLLGYLYHDLVINERSFASKQFLEFIFNAAIPIFPLIAFPNFLLRYIFLNVNAQPIIDSALKKEVLDINNAVNYIELKGENKFEVLIVEKHNLFFARSIENYVQIYHLKNSELEHTIIRSTLANIIYQAPFLFQVHRSYLINLTSEFELNGNSQKAFLSINGYPDKIPVSRSCYSPLKKALQIIPLR